MAPHETQGREGALGATDIQAFVALLARRRFVIALTVMAGVVIGLGSTLLQSKVYVGTALLRTQTPQDSSGDAQAKLNASVQLAKTYTALFNDRSFLTEAARSLDHGITTDELVARIATSTQTDTELIRLSARGPSPAAAQKLAQQVAEFGRDYISSLGQVTTQATIKELNGQIDDLSAQARQLLRDRTTAIAGGDQATEAALNDQLTVIGQRRQALTSEIASLIPQGQAQSAALSIVGPATADASPVSPRPVFSTMLGFFFGLVAGVALAWIRDQLDRTVRTPGDVELTSHRPVLAVIPILRSENPELLLAGVFDSLRVHLSLAASGPERRSRNLRTGRVYTVTSTREWEGKTFTTLGLGHAFARAGKSVIVLDADLRRKGASHDAGELDGIGLAEVLVEDAALGGAIVELEDGLHVLPAGRVIVDPTSCLDSHAFDELLVELRGRYDLILLDTPPIRPVADAALTATRSDGVIMVVRLGVAPRQELSSTFAMLREEPFRLIGSIVQSAEATIENYSYSAGRSEGGSIRGRLARR